jgi:hypothetical protein
VSKLPITIPSMNACRAVQVVVELDRERRRNDTQTIACRATWGASDAHRSRGLEQDMLATTLADGRAYQTPGISRRCVRS